MGDKSCWLSCSFFCFLIYEYQIHALLILTTNVSLEAWRENISLTIFQTSKQHKANTVRQSAVNFPFTIEKIAFTLNRTNHCMLLGKFRLA